MFRRLSCSLFALASFACGVEKPPSFSRQPLAVQAVRLNVLLLVDASGSMESPMNPFAPSCGSCGPGAPCPGSCVTRWSLTRDLVSVAASQVQRKAMVGLSLFPSDTACGAPARLAESFSNAPSLRALAARIPAGGTPTAEALRLASSLPELRDPSADNVVVLVTDGLPNCNPAHPANSCGGAVAQCQCTLSSCASPSFCALGCLDSDATLQAARSLGQQGIQLVTVTVGPEWATPSGLSLAGALGSVSVASAGCGAHCQGVVLSVLDAADQVQVGQQLGTRLAGCAWDVEGPAAEGPLDVEVGQVPLSAVDYVAAGQRLWLGADACNRVRAGAEFAVFAR